jgi:hypothetical protein
MAYFKHSLFLLTLLSSCSCSMRYAKIHVVTTDPAKGSVSLKIIDAKTGLLLGDGLTPTDFIITKQSSDKNPTVSLVVFEKCYPMKWKLVEINKWVKRQSDLSKAQYVNQINVSVIEDKDCIWDTQ